jgi:hypothetical protein
MPSCNVVRSPGRSSSVEGARESLARGDNARTETTKREAELGDRVDDLTSALGEAYAELRVWRKKGALYPRSPSSRR